MAKAEVIQLVGDAITNFTEVQCLTPRYHNCYIIYCTTVQISGAGILRDI